MRPRKIILPIIFIGALIVAAPLQAQSKKTIWAVDFVKAKEGHYDDCLKFLDANWRKARDEAKHLQFIISYKLLILPPTPTNQWDFLLMTEYADKKMYDAREGNFQVVFTKIRGQQGPILINGLGSRQLADIIKSEVLTEAMNSEKK